MSLAAPARASSTRASAATSAAGGEGAGGALAVADVERVTGAKAAPPALATPDAAPQPGVPASGGDAAAGQLSAPRATEPSSGAALASQGAPGSATGPSAPVSAPLAAAASASGAETSAPGSPPSASLAEIMLTRGREAEIAAAASPLLLAGEQPQAELLSPQLLSSIIQFQSLEHGRRVAGAVTQAPHVPALAPHNGLVSVISTAIPASTGGVLASPPPAGAALSSARATAIGTPAATAPPPPPARVDANRAARRGAARPSPQSGANAPLGSISPPSTAGSALGGGATGLTAPAGALLFLAAACLLSTRLLGRRTTGPFTWKSALLSLRLERPG